MYVQQYGMCVQQYGMYVQQYGMCVQQYGMYVQQYGMYVQTKSPGELIKENVVILSFIKRSRCVSIQTFISFVVKSNHWNHVCGSQNMSLLWPPKKRLRTVLNNTSET